MQPGQTISIVNCHAEGEVGDVIVGGVPPPPGETLWQQSRFIAEDQALRRYVMNEPRGGVHRHVNLLVPPVNPSAAAGFIIMEPEDTPPMSGSNCICVATVVLETGRVPMQYPETRLTLEAPGGLVEVVAACKDGKAERITLRNVASFADKLDAELEVKGIGTLKVDTAFGGDSFVIVSGEQLGFDVVAGEARQLAEIGVHVTAAANEQLGFSHPTTDWRHISFCFITGPLETVDGMLSSRNACVIQPGKIDRSPTGTGCSALMAVLRARGQLKAGEHYVGRSIIESRFDCRIVAETDVAGRRAIIPEISGRAWITGTQELKLDPSDPWPFGYRSSDTWPAKR